ncbi:MAG: sulfotransferase [Flavobacteriaceae bacterium]
MSEAAAIEVDPWTIMFGRMLDRFPRLFIKAGDLETRLVSERLGGIGIHAPIHICGLARSGSTILLELLAAHPDTATHRYRDFPLLHVPVGWNWFVDRAGKMDATPRERAHHDRIAITAESPEAFEEVLWMAFFDDLHDPSSSAVLGWETSCPPFEAFYRDHLRKILLLRGAGRYLAKGNYNVTRIGYLLKLFPDARFVIPVRAPADHIASLIKQHRLFSTASEADGRVAEYLRRSGHFEFGPDRRAVNTGASSAVPPAAKSWAQGDETAGWAHQWADVYGHVAGLLEDPIMRDAIMIVRYEDLCIDPAGTLSGILGHCALAPGDIPRRASETVSAPDYYRPSFEKSELATIARITGDVAARFGYRAR